MKTHWSDCSLHSLPARRPDPCDCGGYSGQSNWAEDLFDTWRARWLWKQETAAGWLEFLLGSKFVAYWKAGKC